MLSVFAILVEAIAGDQYRPALTQNKMRTITHIMLLVVCHIKLSQQREINNDKQVKNNNQSSVVENCQALVPRPKTYLNQIPISSIQF